MFVVLICIICQHFNSQTTTSFQNQSPSENELPGGVSHRAYLDQCFNQHPLYDDTEVDDMVPCSSNCYALQDPQLHELSMSMVGTNDLLAQVVAYNNSVMSS